ncbi:MAG: peptidoglycan DD-metalloendopeptidase family protein [Bacillota bacterium]
MGKNEDRLPFSIIRNGDKIKKIKKFGWKGYLLVIVLFIIVGGLVAYYQRSYQTDSLNSIPSENYQESANQNLTLERISQPGMEVEAESEEEKQEEKEVENNSQSESETSEAEQTVPQMSSTTVTSEFNNLVMPVDGEVISNREWYKDEVLDVWKYNSGINIKAEIGAQIKAAHKGVVEEIIKDDYQGLTIIIKYNEMYKTIYSNLEETSVETETEVTKGQVIGKLGDSGVSASDSKLHFEIIKEDKKVKPLKYFN